MSSYNRDPVSGVWMHPMRNGTRYSDGDEVETYLFEVLKQVENVSCDSDQLRESIKDWPSEYHFSSGRHNLLRPFESFSSQRVLELGCGCGAITRYLGESGASVVAIEGSLRRAEIAAERCRDLPNVKIHAENLIDFRSEERFDFVTLIGVLEYAQCFIESDDPVGACLDHAKSFLKKEGALVLAIENQLGLKYFNGCEEDHIGTPYYGISGLYDTKQPVTFGRHALGEKIRQHGFPIQEFFYPFPDYKLPGVVLSEAALLNKQFNVADLLVHNVGKNYPETHRRAFAEDLAWRVVGVNGLIPHLANSFLVFARPSVMQSPPVSWLAKIYSRGKRRPCYQLETTIEEDVNGELVVRKARLHPDLQTQGDWLNHVVTDSLYIDGELLIGRLHTAMAREADIDELAGVFLPWIDFLKANALENGEGQKELPGHFVDCIPSNLVSDQSGGLHYFDAEWVVDGPILLNWVLMRGVRESLTGAASRMLSCGV